MRSKYFYGLIGLITLYRIQRATIVSFLLSHTTHSFLVVPFVTDRLPIDVCLTCSRMSRSRPVGTVTITLFA
jgi:hypothetical protein